MEARETGRVAGCLGSKDRVLAVFASAPPGFLQDGSIGILHCYLQDSTVDKLGLLRSLG